MTKPKKIVIDARMYGLEHAGIGRYIANLIREMKNEKLKIKNLEIGLLVRKEKLREMKKEFGSEFQVMACNAPHYSFKEQILLPIQLFKLKPDLVHFPHFNVPVFWWGKQVVTIHDLIKHESRGAETTTRWRPLYWFKYLNYSFLVRLVVKRAAKILVPSKWWKKELIERYKLPRNKVVVTYEGVGEGFKTKNLKLKTTIKNFKILEKYHIRKPFVIYTGSLYPHKNVERLVQAVACLNDLPRRRAGSNHLNKTKNLAFRKWPKDKLKDRPKDTSELARRSLDSSEVKRKEKVTLVVACSRSVFYERFKKKIKEMRADKFVNLIGFVPDEELVFLYQQAEAFVFPSLLEGFGLPGLEAMACGCPVVASAIPVLKEIYGKAALFFDPLDVEDIAGKILKVTRNTLTPTSRAGRRNRLIKLGLERVERYSWQKMAKETIRVYKEALYV